MLELFWGTPILEIIQYTIAIDEKIMVVHNYLFFLVDGRGVLGLP